MGKTQRVIGAWRLLRSVRSHFRTSTILLRRDNEDKRNASPERSRNKLYHQRIQGRRVRPFRSTRSRISGDAG